jgi:hypothetical protein
MPQKPIMVCHNMADVRDGNSAGGPIGAANKFAG